MEKTQTQRNNRQNKAAYGHEIAAGTGQEWLHPAPNTRSRTLAAERKSVESRAMDPKNWKCEPTRTSPCFVFQQGTQKRKPSFRRKDRVADMKSSIHWEKKPLCFQTKRESISSPNRRVRSAGESGRCEQKWRYDESKIYTK